MFPSCTFFVVSSLLSRYISACPVPIFPPVLVVMFAVIFALDPIVCSTFATFIVTFSGSFVNVACVVAVAFWKLFPVTLAVI